MCYSLLEPLWGCMPSLRHQHSREGPLPWVILCSNPSGATHHPLSISTAGRDLYHVLFSAQTPLWPNAIPRGSALCTHRLLCHRPFPPSVSPRVGVSAEAELCSLGPRAGAVQGGEGGAERRGAAGAACQPAAPRGRGPAKSAPPEERAQEAELRAGPPHLLGTGGGESGGSHPSVQTARVSVGCCLQSRAWADCSLSLSSWWVPKPSVYRRTAACRVRPSPSQPVGRAGWGAWRCVWLKDAALSCDVGTTLITSQPRAVLQHCHVPRGRTFCHPPPAA